MAVRTSGEMLATSDSVAMTPTIQPAAVGTHENPDGRRGLDEPGTDGCGTVLAVIGRENMPSAADLGASADPGVGPGSPDRAGVLLPGAVTGFLGSRAGLPERQLQALQSVA